MTKTPLGEVFGTIPTIPEFSIENAIKMWEFTPGFLNLLLKSQGIVGKLERLSSQITKPAVKAAIILIALASTRRNSQYNIIRRDRNERLRVGNRC